jgi:branched-chain amino acid transport system substrate-binding protein
MISKRLVSTVVTAIFVVSAAMTTGSAGAQSKSKQTVKVGSILPIETGGSTVASGAPPLALQASVKAFNKRSDTIELELVLCDSHADPNDEAKCAREMVDEGVVATLGDLTPANPAGVNEVLIPADIARIGDYPAGLADYQSPVVFPFLAGAVGNYATMGTQLAKQGKTKIALLRPDSNTSGALAPFISPAIEAGGGKIVADIGIPNATADYAPFVTAVTSAGAEGVMFAVSEKDTEQFLIAANQLNADFTVAVPAGALTGPELEDLLPITQDAVLIESLPAVSLSTKEFPGLKQFKADMKASGDPVLKPKNLTTTELRMWVAVLAFQKFTEGLDTFDAPSVLAAVKAAQDVDLDGLTPPWTPSDPGPTELFQQFSQPYVWVMGFDGKKITISPPAINAFEYFPGAKT